MDKEPAGTVRDRERRDGANKADGSGREMARDGAPVPAGDALAGIRFDDRGLVPVVVQDRARGEVLMLAYASREALARTLAEGRAWFFSRSRQRLWRKGETSGNELAVAEVRVDCDGDAVLYLVDPAGPACHTGRRSCFHRDPAGRELSPPTHPDASSGASAEASPAASPEAAQTPTPEPPGPRSAAPGDGAGAFLTRLEALIRDRRRRRPAGSYTTALFEAGLPRILQKVGEEAVETVVAGGHQEPARLVEEAADLVYHLTVLLVARDVSWNDVMAELSRRSHPAG